MKRLNNRLLNSSCDESSVSKRTVSRWKKIFADSAKKKKIDDVLSDERSVVEQKCDRINSNFEQSTIIDDHITGDDNITAVDDDIDIYSDNKSICHDAAIDSSCSDIYSICSCCNDDISSDDELNPKIDDKIHNEKLLETHQVEGDRIMFPAANLKVSDVLLMIQMFSISKNLTKTGENDLLKLVKVLAGPDFEAWDYSYYLRSKIFGVPDDKITLHFFCETCNIILTKRSLQHGSKKEKVRCDKCTKDHNISSQATNYFMSVDIRYQIQLILNQPQIQDSFLKHTTTDNQSSNIVDIRDSNLYKNFKRQYPHVFTLNYNTDGAPIFKSSKQSFWPQQLVINELPLEERFKHIILGGIFLTNAEPKSEFINLYNEELCNQIVDLMNNGVDLFNHLSKKIFNLKFALLCCCVDTPARATCQNRVKFSGYYGCSWCYEPGFYVGHAVHYPLSEIDPDLRTHKSHLANINEVEKIKKSSEVKNKAPTVMGVKGSMIFVKKLPFFDSIWGFPIDYMHGCLLGVTRQILELLKTPGVKYKLTKQDREAIDQRLISIKPPHEIYRLPRPTADMSKWKASEFESWLLYWSLLCLDGIANPEFLEMYALFVRSVFTLLKREITEEDIARTDYDLTKFVGTFQIEFSKSAMTFNLHSVGHLCKSVLETGPMTGTSAFPFENGIFNFKKEVTGPRSVSHQITKKFLKKKMLLSRLDYLTTSAQCKNFCKELFRHDEVKDFLKLSDEITLIAKTRIHVQVENEIKDFMDDNRISINAYKKCVYKNTVIHSKDYTRTTKTNDTYIQLKSNDIIHIHHLFVMQEQCYIYGCCFNTIPYAVGNVEMDHIHRITNNCGDRKVRYSNENNNTIVSKVGSSEETNHDSKISKNKSCKRKQNDNTSQNDESSNKENNPVSPKKTKKEPGLSKQKGIIAKSNTLINNHFIMVKPKMKEVKIPADPNEGKVDKNKSEKSQASPSKNSSPQISPDITLTHLTEESDVLPLTFLGASSSQYAVYSVEKKSNKSNDPTTLNVSESGKSKKKKKHHNHDNKEDTLARINQVEQGIKDLMKELELQKQMLQKILDFWNEHRDTPSNHGSVELEKKTGCPQVGFTRVSDNSIHLGQGVYVPKNSYLTAASRSKTPSQFVRKMIMAVFTPKELQDCSVHGAKSNKVKQANQKGGLDPIRLQAVKDIFSYYLKESGEFDKEKHDAQMKQFYVYVSSKITDTRAGVKRVPKVKPVENTDTEDIDSSDIEENTVASDGEEDSGQSTDEDKGERNDNSESDNTMSHQKKDEETDCDHEVETTEAVSNAAEEKLNQERSEHKDESELNNMSTQGEEKEKVTD